ncbi:MAG: formylmethanofuran dehydrogenase [Planctomycetota bacterium]|nr:MAG: formylmethanofuran dehydrogenase [Planctomycetota bacterium]
MTRTIELMLNPIRSAKQGAQINVGKFNEDYESIVTELSMHPDDMAAIGASDGDRVLVRTEVGQAEFVCQAAKVPAGMAFVPYGPPTCQLMGGDTGGTGMPTSKGWTVQVQRIDPQ